jgi:hypothetical protein
MMPSGVAMNSYKKFLVLASLSTIINYSAPTAKYAALESDGPDADARPVAAIAPTSVANRKPAVEPRVYVESADSKTGFVYYDMPGQVQHAVPAEPKPNP